MSKNRRAGEKRAKKNKKRITKKKLFKKAKLDLQSSLETPQPLVKKSKLSQTILEFGKPLIDEAKTIEQEKHAIEISIFIWNISLLSSSKEDGLEKIKKISENPKGFSNLIMRDFIETFELLYERKEKYFDHDKRVAVEFSLEKTDTGFYLQVTPGRKKTE